jgi:phage FluMu protein Com
MDETSLRLDGNALGGAFQELFVQEVTSAHVECAHCGKVEPIGAEHVYMHAPGAVVRCRHCESVLMVLVDTGSGYRLAAQGCAWLEMRDQT